MEPLSQCQICHEDGITSVNWNEFSYYFSGKDEESIGNRFTNLFTHKLSCVSTT